MYVSKAAVVLTGEGLKLVPSSLGCFSTNELLVRK